MNMVHKAVDAMVIDHAPEEIVAGEIVAGEIVAGAIQGARDLNLRMSLIGDSDTI